MTHQDNGLRRREDDFTLHHATQQPLYPGKDRRRRAGKQPGRVPGSFLRKFRHPIIGLSLAGVSAPLIHAQRPQTNTTRRAPTTEASAAPTEAELARTDTPQTAGMDAEDAVAAKIASEHHGAIREAAVAGAVDRYSIDHGLATDIYEVARQEGIEPKLAYGLVKTESSFKPHAISNVGARGLTQVMPKTARWLVPGTKPDDLYERRTNLRLGFRYLNQLIDKYSGDVRLALLAYNRGPGTVDRILKRGGDPNNGYADKVLGG